MGVKMVIRAYLSNITPRTCPIERQEETLAANVPGWPRDVSIYRDVKLSVARRKARDTSALLQRANLLRRTGRQGGTETIYLASLAVLAWTADDFMACLAAASARGATIVALDTKLRIEPNAGAEALAAAVKEFASAKRRPQAGGPLIGAAASKASRLADSERRIALIREDWPLPEPPTPVLLLRAGRKKDGERKVTPMAYGTAVKYLGHRPNVQDRHKRRMALIERNHARKASNDAET